MYLNVLPDASSVHYTAAYRATHLRQKKHRGLSIEAIRCDLCEPEEDDDAIDRDLRRSTGPDCPGLFYSRLVGYALRSGAALQAAETEDSAKSYGPPPGPHWQ